MSVSPPAKARCWFSRTAGVKHFMSPGLQFDGGVKIPRMAAQSLRQIQAGGGRVSHGVASEWVESFSWL